MKSASLLSVCSLLAIAAFPTFLYGQTVTNDFDDAMVTLSADPQAGVTLEAECLAILAADTDWNDKYRAIRILAGIGSQAAIPHLAALLTDARLSHPARIALEALPYPEAAAAIRDALATTSGPQLLGAIASLAYLRDSESVPALTAFLHKVDLETAEAAATALGRIAAPAAVAALWETAGDAVDSLRLACGKALLAAADQLVISGNREASIDIYGRILENASWPDYIQTGAFNGLLHADPVGAADLVQKAIQGDIPLFQVAGIAAVARLKGAGITDRFAALLPSLAPNLQALLLDALAEREDAVALAVVHDALKGSEAGVRLSAMKAISTHGDASSVVPLCKLLAGSANRQEKLAVIETLRRLEGLEIDETILSQLRQGKPELASDLLDVLAQRNAIHLIDAIFDQLNRAAVRPAAFKTLGTLARPSDIERMIDALSQVDGDVSRPEAETALAAIVTRMAQQQGNIIIHKALYGDLPSGGQFDVTQKVAAAVSGGSLSIQASNALSGDPAPNIVKKLSVSYTLNETPAETVIAEGETLSLKADALPQSLADLFTSAIERARTPAAVSLMRVLSRIGGQAAFDIVAARLEHDDADVRNGAIRALAAWPDPAAVEILAGLFASGLEPSQRVPVLRGCVRLLQAGALNAPAALQVYEHLVAATPAAEELRIILSGLAQVNDPGALPLVQSFLTNPDVHAEALSALQRLGSSPDIAAPSIETSGAEEGFVSIFNAQDLSGWSGDPSLWRVEGGFLVGETHADAPIKYNTFLCWEGDEPADFELKFRYIIESDWANSGIQIRSERFEDYRVRGYQPDIASEDWITGICYEEAGRGILARRGQSVTLAPENDTQTAQFGDEKELGTHIHPRDWNEYHIIARGDHFVSLVNGQIMHEITDTAPEARRKGVLAFQLHAGPPMKIRFADIRMKTLVNNDSE